MKLRVITPKKKVETFQCDCCGQDMRLIKTVGTKQSGKPYRQRWFHCDLCDISKKIYAGGEIDEHINPENAIRSAKRMENKLVKERR